MNPTIIPETPETATLCVLINAPEKRNFIDWASPLQEITSPHRSFPLGTTLVDARN
jgi:hypothetical protein